jgi:hypothetical protein
MATDVNGSTIQLGDMLKFKEDIQALGIVKRFSVVSGDGVLVTVCGGGDTGERMINASKAQIVTNEVMPQRAKGY